MAFSPSFEQAGLALWRVSLWFRKAEVIEDLDADLERLARLSPHLLADVGFAPDPQLGAPGVDVWRRGRLTVTIRDVPPTVTVGAARGGVPPR